LACSKTDLAIAMLVGICVGHIHPFMLPAPYNIEGKKLKKRSKNFLYKE
jgi:hypothetical protein